MLATATVSPPPEELALVRDPVAEPHAGLDVVAGHDGVSRAGDEPLQGGHVLFPLSLAGVPRPTGPLRESLGSHRIELAASEERTLGCDPIAQAATRVINEVVGHQCVRSRTSSQTSSPGGTPARVMMSRC